MPPKPAPKKKKPPANQQKKKTTKTSKATASKDKAKGGKTGKAAKPGARKKAGAGAGATGKNGKDGGTKGGANNVKGTPQSKVAAKDKGVPTPPGTLPESADAGPEEESTWMQDYPQDPTGNGADPEEELADNEEEEGDDEEEEDDEIARYFDKLESRVLSTLSDLPYAATSITETVRNAFRQHRLTMPIPEAATVAGTSGGGTTGAPPPSDPASWQQYRGARYDLSSGTANSVPTLSGWGSRTATFLTEEFGRSVGAMTEEAEMAADEDSRMVTAERIVQVVQSYSAEIRRELSWSMRESPRRCRSASIDRLMVGRPQSSRQRIGCTCCRNGYGPHDVTDQAGNDVTVTTSRPQTASSRTGRMARPRTASRGAALKEFDRDFRKSTSGSVGTTTVNKPPIPSSFAVRPTSRASFSGIRHAKSTSSVNIAGTSVTTTNTSSSQRSRDDSHVHHHTKNRSGQDGGAEDSRTAQDNTNGRMSLSELPPISGNNRRPSSGRSRRSSTHSQGSRSGGGGTGTGSGTRLTAETTEIVALNNGYGETSSKMTKRGTRSPGSTGGSSGQAQSNGTGTSPRNGGGVGGSSGDGSSGLKYRNKSWCSPDGSSMAAAAAGAGGKGDSKLETLFEQKASRRVSDSNAPRVALSNGVGESSGSGELFKRTKSFNNLASNNNNIKPGAKATQGKTRSSGTGGALTKVHSEQNIASMGRKPSTSTQHQPVAATPRRRNASTSQAPNNNKNNAKQSMRVSKSTPNFVSKTGSEQPPVPGTPRDQVVDDARRHHPAAYNTNNHHHDAAGAAGTETERTSLSEDPFEEVDPEEEQREQRIIDWLIGVESERLERPPSPSIIDEEPTQTDTAIHIVYDGE